VAAAAIGRFVIASRRSGERTLPLVCNDHVTLRQERQGTIRLGRVGRIARLAVALSGIALLVNGTVRATDDVWPFGPMSQYAGSVPGDASITSIRISAQTTAGRTIDVPLEIGGAGIARAEIEARTSQIVADPSLLQAVAAGWARKHPDKPGYLRLELIRDTTRLVDGRVNRPPSSEVLATWLVRR
jgi:hypothetical protein